MQRPLIILGTGNSALDILDLAESLTEAWRVVGFLDDTKLVSSRIAGLPVLGAIAEASDFPGHAFVAAFQNDDQYCDRMRIADRSGLSADRFATLVHPRASVSPRAELGSGTCVHHGATIAGNVKIGSHVEIGPGAVVGNDCVISDGALLGPRCNLGSFVRLGCACYIGAGAAVRQGVSVADGARVELGAVVLRDVPPGARVAGNPALPFSCADWEER